MKELGERYKKLDPKVKDKYQTDYEKNKAIYKKEVEKQDECKLKEKGPIKKDAKIVEQEIAMKKPKKKEDTKEEKIKADQKKEKKK